MFFENEAILDMIKILKFKAGLISNMDIFLDLLSYEVCYKTGKFWQIWLIETSGG